MNKMPGKGAPGGSAPTAAIRGIKRAVKWVPKANESEEWNDSGASSSSPPHPVRQLALQPRHLSLQLRDATLVLPGDRRHVLLPRGQHPLQVPHGPLALRFAPLRRLPQLLQRRFRFLARLLEPTQLAVQRRHGLPGLHHAALARAHERETHALADRQLPFQAADLTVQLDDLRAQLPHLREKRHAGGSRARAHRRAPGAAPDGAARQLACKRCSVISPRSTFSLLISRVVRSRARESSLRPALEAKEASGSSVSAWRERMCTGCTGVSPGVSGGWTEPGGAVCAWTDPRGTCRWDCGGEPALRAAPGAPLAVAARREFWPSAPTSCGAGRRPAMRFHSKEEEGGRDSGGNGTRAAAGATIFALTIDAMSCKDSLATALAVPDLPFACQSNASCRPSMALRKAWSFWSTCSPSTHAAAGDGRSSRAFVQGSRLVHHSCTTPRWRGGGRHRVCAADKADKPQGPGGCEASPLRERVLRAHRSHWSRELLPPIHGAGWCKLVGAARPHTGHPHLSRPERAA